MWVRLTYHVFNICSVHEKQWDDKNKAKVFVDINCFVKIIYVERYVYGSNLQNDIIHFSITFTDQS